MVNLMEAMRLSVHIMMMQMSVLKIGSLSPIECVIPSGLYVLPAKRIFQQHHLACSSNHTPDQLRPLGNRTTTQSTTAFLFLQHPSPTLAAEGQSPVVAEAGLQVVVVQEAGEAQPFGVMSLPPQLVFL